MHGAKLQRLDQVRETSRVVGERESRRKIGGTPGARLIPGDHREVVGQALELRLPVAPVSSRAVREHERRALTLPLVRNLEPVYSEDLHFGRV